MRAPDEPLFMISTVAQMFNIHPQTLRLYEREGFIKPSRTNGNTRLYSLNDVGRIGAILRLTRQMGVNLAGVEVILEMREKMKGMQQELDDLKGFIKGTMGDQYEEWKEKRRFSLVTFGPNKVVKVDVKKG